MAVCRDAGFDRLLRGEFWSREGEAGASGGRSEDTAGTVALCHPGRGGRRAQSWTRLVSRDIAYHAGWRRGVPVNYHGLSDFRVGWSEELDRLLTESVTALVSEGLVELDTRSRSTEPRCARRPRRGRSRAGDDGWSGSKRQAARSGQERLRREVAWRSGSGDTPRRNVGRHQERGAREPRPRWPRRAALNDRLRREKEARAKTRPQENAQGRPFGVADRSGSAADALRDGAVRAGYNVQTAAVPDQGLIVAVMTTDRRNDQGLAPAPLVDAVARRYGRARAGEAVR